MIRLITFRDWLLKFRGVDLPIGDLAVHAAYDKRFPNTRDYDVVHYYLIYEVKASTEVMMAFEAAYDYYKNSSSVYLRIIK